jgi:hypothetical protein
MGLHVKNILLFFLTLVICLYLSETLLGFYLTKSLPRYTLPPYSEQRHATVSYDVQYRYNNVSLRGVDFHPEQTYDAVLLGDSFFFGQGVGEGKTFASLLQLQGHKVLNASEIATNPIDYFHKLRILQSHRLKTKKIIIGLCMGNDFQDIAQKRIDHALRYAYRPEFLSYGARQFLALERLRYQVDKKRLQLMDWLECRLSGNACRETAAVHDFEHRRRFYDDWLQFFTNNRQEIMKAMLGGEGKAVGKDIAEEDYLKMAQFSEESLRQTAAILSAAAHVSRPIPVYVVLIPGPHYVMGFRSSGYDRFVERLKANLQQTVSIIDLHGIMTPAMHFPRDGHWNEQGHRFIASLMAERILPVL